MIIWQGRGWLVAVIVFCSSLAANLISNSFYGDGYYDQHKWPFAISLLVSAAICVPLSLFLASRSDQVVVDKASGEEFILNRSRHSLFFIPIKFWAPILIVFALILISIEFTKKT